MLPTNKEPTLLDIALAKARIEASTKTLPGVQKAIETVTLQQTTDVFMGKSGKVMFPHNSLAKRVFLGGVSLKGDFSNADPNLK